MIQRSVYKELKKWYENDKGALLVTGARQTGKTWIIRHYLKENSLPYIELNFIEHPEYVSLFSNAHGAEDVLVRISAVSDQPLEKGRTVIFFDEVQECREIVTMIKFLVDQGDYRYIMSGSLLGVELKSLRSVPVGYMSVVDMYPLDLYEFTQALGVSENVISLLEKCYREKLPVDHLIHDRMMDIVYLYLIVGGMPAAVSEYLATNDLNRVRDVQKEIVRLYKADFTKYEQKYQLKLREIYDAVPGQLNEPNKRFKISRIGGKTEFSRLENDFLWLKDAGVVIPVYNITDPKAPIQMSEKRNLFKLFLSDVGLLTSCYSNQVRLSILGHDKDINHGALFENLAAQQLLANGVKPYYFNSKKQGELDFVIELDGRVVPIEMKSGKDYKKHSALCNVLKDTSYRVEKGLIFSSGNVSVDGKKIYMPVYMMMFVKETEPEQSVYRINLEGLK